MAIVSNSVHLEVGLKIVKNTKAAPEFSFVHSGLW